jgi:tripartite ATP-independent transporter DctP family solute receptor
MIFSFVAVSLIYALLVCCTTSESSPTVIRFGSLYSEGTPTGDTAIYLEELIESRSEGSIDFQIYPAEQMGTEEEMVQSVSIGALEMTIPGTGIAGRFLREYLIFPLVFTFEDWRHLSRVVEGPIGDELAQKFLQATGAQVLASNWFREPRFLFGTRPVRKLEDLQNFTIRVPENPIWIEGWKRLGAAPMPIALGETYTALQQGAINGCETTISYGYNNGFHKIAPYLMLSRHVFETNILIINEAFFQTLSQEYQDLLKEAALEAGRYHQELVINGTEGTLEKIEAEGGTLVKIDRDRWIEKVNGLGEELAVYYGDGLFQRIRAEASEEFRTD